MAMAATRSGHGLLARLSSSLPGTVAGSPLPCSSHRTSVVVFFSRSSRVFPRILASSFSGRSEPASWSSSSSSSTSSPSSPSSSSSAASSFAPTWAGAGVVYLDPKDRPRMPAVPEERPKPTTAVTVVEAYLEKLWRDFFTNPHNWFDNRLRRRAPKYADFKNKLTKEGLWITAKWNPPWVRTELSLMTQFRAVPYDDPLWAKKAAEEEEEKREKPPPVAPGAWLQEELKAKKAATAAAAAAAAGTVSSSATVETWRRSETSNTPSSASAPEIRQEQE